MATVKKGDAPKPKPGTASKIKGGETASKGSGGKPAPVGKIKGGKPC
jgi:hypothetical protein